MELIQIGLYPDEKKKNIWRAWRRKRMRRRGTWVKSKKNGYGREWSEIILPASRSEGRELGTNWFWDSIQKIQQKYPDAILYYTPDVCRVFELAQYRKQWICWYFLFPQIWMEINRVFQIKDQRKDMVIYDTKDDRAKFLVSKLIERAGRIEICTKCPQKWEKYSEQCYEEYGLALEISKEVIEMVETEEEKIIWDIEGTFYKKYPLWEKKHIIVAFDMKEEHVEYLRYRLAWGRVVYGYEETIQEQEISHKFASLLMQSANWRICQLARSEAISFEDRDIGGITLYYQWKLKAIKTLTMSREWAIIQ